MKELGIGGGTLYPILQRFEDEKWLEARWEDADPRAEGRPRRRYYQITALGQEVARAEVRRASGQLSTIKWGFA
jgi:DNA-binding PadR family transcriptional regulator